MQTSFAFQWQQTKISGIPEGVDIMYQYSTLTPEEIHFSKLFESLFGRQGYDHLQGTPLSIKVNSHASLIFLIRKVNS